MTTSTKSNTRATLKWSAAFALVTTLLVGEAAATGSPSTIIQTSVTELEIISLLGRIHELLRNIAYLLGPIILLHGITLWALGSKNSSWSQAGYTAMVGGFILFGLALAMDILLQLAAFIGDV
ncbi:MULTISPECIES: hypothetical protein [Haloferacaceae]|uniref:TrbC/VIRB2 family protein n=2 Tax=Haloferacaceae TaxID=1644056 RepID=A0ABD6DBF2_9EURY|nr:MULTISPECIES: hypothetical protein [Halorubraceae]